tara:strand:+ start:1275 stop:1490 length:216 start_codon:yes stop_codon:yes gene_type:complete
MRPKGVPNKLTSTVKNKLDTIIDETMESINIDSLTNAEKIKLVEVCLRYVMPRNANNHIPLPEDIEIKIVR